MLRSGVRMRSECWQILLNVAQGGISGLVSHVGETSEHLNLAEQQFVDNFSIMNEAIENLTNAMGDVAQNISQQAESTTDVAGSVEKIAQNIQSTTADIEDLSENASFMKKCSQDSYTSMENLLEVNQQTIRNIEVMYQQTEYTNESVNKISEAATLNQSDRITDQSSFSECVDRGSESRRGRKRICSSSRRDWTISFRVGRNSSGNQWYH